MKPRNDEERRVVALSPTLADIKQRDIDWIDRDYKRTYKGKGLSYYLILQRCKEYQVIRYFYKRPRTFFEFAQVWIKKGFKAIIAKNRFMGVDRWVRDSEMTIKDWFRYGHEYTYLGGVDRIGWSGCKIDTVSKELRMRGLKTGTHGLNPVKLCLALLESNRIETLYKLRQYRLVHYFLQSHKKFSDEKWQAIRVALRHGYQWSTKEEVGDWMDMIDDLVFLGKDIRNPYYICPNNFEEKHLYWTYKARIKRFLDGERGKVIAYEPTFKEQRERFFDMLIKDDNIEIKVIPTAMGIVEEGAHMCHCVGGYYDKPNSLILSAKIDGKRIETIEVDLRGYRLVQSRGLQNKHTEYHNLIVNLVENNMQEIKIRNEKLRKLA